VKSIRLIGRPEHGRPIADANISGYLPGSLDYTREGGFNLIGPNSISNSKQADHEKQELVICICLFILRSTLIAGADSQGARRGQQTTYFSRRSERKAETCKGLSRAVSRLSVKEPDHGL
jgi:hypothetical protein